MNHDYESPVPKDHNTRRAVALEIAVIYGALLALIVWNWW
jgi:hypothetical protein